MTNAQMEEIYALSDAALQGGQDRIPVHVFPFRMTEANMAARKDSEWSPFWATLKPGYDLFERTRMPPRISVCEKQYVATHEDAVLPDGCEDNVSRVQPTLRGAEDCASCAPYASCGVQTGARGKPCARSACDAQGRDSARDRHRAAASAARRYATPVLAPSDLPARGKRSRGPDRPSPATRLRTRAGPTLPLGWRKLSRQPEPGLNRGQRLAAWWASARMSGSDTPYMTPFMLVSMPERVPSR